MNPCRPPSFFKMLLDPSAHHLSLPSEFVSMHLKNKIPTDPLLRSADGCHSWRLKLNKIGENYCFTHGWNNVVQDKLLGAGDLLVFWLVNQSTFKMLIYSPNGCEKIVPPKKQVEHVDVEVHDVTDDGSGDDDVEDGSDDPSFTTIMTITHNSKLRLPAHFVGLPGMIDYGSIIVKDLEGKEWPVTPRLDKSFRSSERYYLASGWRDFVRSHKLSVGDKCVFKFIRSEGKICLTKITRNKSSQPHQPTLLTNRVKRKRGLREHDSDAHVKSEDECVEVVNGPRGTPPLQKSRVVYF
ncbi:B3 domain-containing protein REM5-like [Rutidosis leptorrhynchoides]|uniref:B3 domain-containing protein REM5-like n=1 Tax=Rutidosis leptorrhynchoides TaxID=125765 RepID=UPI003A99DECC